MRVPWRTGLGRASRASQASGRTRAVRRREVLRPTLFVNASFRANGFRCSSRACKAASCATRATCAVTCPFSACDGRATCATTSVRVENDVRVSEQARASIAEAQISLPTNRASRRTPLDAAPRPRTRTRDPHAFSSRRVHLVSVPNGSRSPKWRDSGGQVSRSCVSASKTRKRKRSSDLERTPSSSNTLIHHAHAYIETRITPYLPTQTSARIATAHPTLCALEVRRTPGRTRPTTRRRRTRRRRTTARPFIPANSAP